MNQNDKELIREYPVGLWVTAFVFFTVGLYSFLRDFSLGVAIGGIVIGLLLVILLGSIGYVAVGTLLASMAVQTRTRDILLPILLFPVEIPVFIAAVKASTGFLQGVEVSEIMPWINLLIVYDVVFTAVAFMLFDYVVEE